MSEEKTPSFKEQRIRNLTHLYYSQPEIQKVLFEFSKNREISPRYFEGFGKRPDAFQYPGDVFELAKKGATSFHCSEELWRDPLQLSTNMNEKQLNDLRIGWDLLIDIDSKYIDYSKVSAMIILDFLKFHGVKNIGIKFSGSKGFHLIIPWKAFPKDLGEQEIKDLFPELPRILTKYIMKKTEKQLIEKITEFEKPNKYIKDFEAPKKVMPDIILVSPRHLFRMPYSLHEKTALASIVLTREELENFDLKHANPMQAKIRNFIPDSKEAEATEFVREALDWYRHSQKNTEEQDQKTTGKYANFKPIKLDNLSDKNFPPCIKKILQGVEDGKKRSLFVLINLFRSIGMDKEELEKRIYDWNKKNTPPLKQGIIKAQLSWTYKRKPLMPPNCKEFYKNLGVCEPDEFCRLIKNPVNYTIRKNFSANKTSVKKSAKKKVVKKKTSSDNFKEKNSKN
ncbi:hypothetical protein K9L16_01560 [Candidatus Pacearchaeota archaeon]|nr:hypothetical protein [Candidatus Pacearchaeota archaeon]